LITAVLGVLIMPWKLIETSHGYIFTWLVAYSALLGAVGGDFGVRLRAHPIGAAQSARPVRPHRPISLRQRRQLARRRCAGDAILPCAPGFASQIINPQSRGLFLVPPVYLRVVRELSLPLFALVQAFDCSPPRGRKKRFDMPTPPDTYVNGLKLPNPFVIELRSPRHELPTSSAKLSMKAGAR
jgi:hypothetical protein